MQDIEVADDSAIVGMFNHVEIAVGRCVAR